MLNKLYLVATIECPIQVGGTDHAKQVLTRILSTVGGMSQESIDEKCILEVTDNNVLLLTNSKAVAKRMHGWRVSITSILKGLIKQRKLSGYMFHSIHNPRTI
jgi:hypothetical protein